MYFKICLKGYLKTGRMHFSPVKPNSFQGPKVPALGPWGPAYISSPRLLDTTVLCQQNLKEKFLAPPPPD